MPDTMPGFTRIAVLVLILVCAASVAQAQEILLFEDFDAAPLDTGTTWPAAYNHSLAPVSDEALNHRFHWDIDCIMFTRPLLPCG